MNIPEITPVQHICCTSVDDGKSSLQHETRIEIVQEALEYEKAHQNRTTMIKALEIRLRVLGKQNMKTLAKTARQINGVAA